MWIFMQKLADGMCTDEILVKMFREVMKGGCNGGQAIGDEGYSGGEYFLIPLVAFSCVQLRSRIKARVTISTVYNE